MNGSQVKDKDFISQSESNSDFPPLKRNDSVSINGTQTINDVEQSHAQQVMESKSSPPTGQQNGSAHVIKSDEGTEGKIRKQWEDCEPSLGKYTERRVTWNHGQQVSLNPKDNTNQDSLQGTHLEKNGQSSNGTQHDDLRNETLSGKSGQDFLSESGNFVRKLGSPRLRRQRPNNPQPDSSGTGSQHDSDANQKRASTPSVKPQDTHRVLKLGSLKNNNGVFWCDTEEISSPDPQTISEPEKRLDVDLETKPKLKTQRSVSVTEMSFSHASSLPTHRLNPSPPPAPDSQASSSSLQDLLQRAKQREKECRLGRAKARKYSLPSTSPLIGDGDREAEVMRNTSTQKRAQNELKGGR